MLVEVSLTVGKLDASLALLTTKNHHVIEFPTMLLPDNVKAGSIVKIQVSEDLAEELKQKEKFQEIQNSILSKYGTHEPKSPVLKLVNVTQTSCVLEWDFLELGSSQLKSLVLYKDGNRSLVIPNPLKNNATKVSGLSIDTEYEFQLKLTTTSGQFLSGKLKVQTHKMTDMSGITICLDPLNSLVDVSRDQIERSLANIGAKPLQDHVGLDTTHFICCKTDDASPELEKARNRNIPIVRPEWIRACELERRIVGVRGFYLDVDASTLKIYKFLESDLKDSVTDEIHEQISNDPTNNDSEKICEENQTQPIFASTVSLSENSSINVIPDNLKNECSELSLDHTKKVSSNENLESKDNMPQTTGSSTEAADTLSESVTDEQPGMDKICMGDINQSTKDVYIHDHNNTNTHECNNMQKTDSIGPQEFNTPIEQQLNIANVDEHEIENDNDNINGVEITNNDENLPIDVKTQDNGLSDNKNTNTLNGTTKKKKKKTSNKNKK